MKQQGAGHMARPYAGKSGVPDYSPGTSSTSMTVDGSGL